MIAVTQCGWLWLPAQRSAPQGFEVNIQLEEVILIKPSVLTAVSMFFKSQRAPYQLIFK